MAVGTRKAKLKLTKDEHFVLLVNGRFVGLYSTLEKAEQAADRFSKKPPQSAFTTWGFRFKIIPVREDEEARWP